MDPRETQRRARHQNARVRTVERAARAALRDGPIVARTPEGEVRVQEVSVSVDVDGLECLEVRVSPGGNGESRYRIFNPPTHTRRPDGSAVEDPVAALVQVVARYGGATARKPRAAR
jgi:hypothetical protein